MSPRPKKRTAGWRGDTLAKRVALLEKENDALNKHALAERERVDQIVRSMVGLSSRIEQLENHPHGCTCTRCTG